MEDTDRKYQVSERKIESLKAKLKEKDNTLERLEKRFEDSMRMQKKVAQQQQQLSRQNLENALSEMSTELRRINDHAQGKISIWKRRFNVC